MAVAFFFATCAPGAQGPAPAADGQTQSAPLTFPLEVKWTAALPAPPAFGPAFSNDHAYVPLRTNQLVAVSLKDGTTTWSVECPTTAAPAAGDGLVFVANEAVIEGRTQTDGRAQWQRSVTGRVTALHWDTGWLLASTETGPMLAIRAADGEVLWQREFGAPLQATPAINGERVYLALKDGRVLALTLATGEQIWSRTLDEPASGILPVGNRVYVSGKDNQMHSLKADDGDGDWHWRTGADVLGVPVLDNKRVYFVALDNILRGHDRNSGSMEWKRVLPVRPFTGPILSGNILIVSGVASELYGYNTADGKDAGNIAVKGAENEEMLLAAPPHLTTNSLIVLVTKGGQVRAVGSQPAAAAPAPESPPPGAAPGSPAEPAPAGPEQPGEPDAAGGAAPPGP